LGPGKHVLHDQLYSHNSIGNLIRGPHGEVRSLYR
jgi:hypothetical protein